MSRPVEGQLLNRVRGGLCRFPVARTTTLDNGQVTKDAYTYDSGFTFHDVFLGNSYTPDHVQITSTTPCDYGNGAPGSVLRYTNTSYIWPSPNPNHASYLSNNLLDLPYSVQVKDGGNFSAKGGHRSPLTRLPSFTITYA
jgi:hypothetical protein